MSLQPESLLAALLSATPAHTAEAPQDARGLYGLIDHRGELRYIGSTSAAAETLHKRIHQRHRTGSENGSHYFSRMYNMGRMWRDPSDRGVRADGKVAKALRNAFVAEHCRAVWVPLADTAPITRLEAEVLALAPRGAVAWNRRGMEIYDEPVELVDATIRRLRLGSKDLDALERQRQRCWSGRAPALPAPTLCMQSINPVTARNGEPKIRPLPKGPFRFAALDVETADNDRSSICQIGLALVRSDGSIATWMTYVDPQVSVWIWSSLHGITAATVQGAPTFAEVLLPLAAALRDMPVYGYSGFDRSAIAAACARVGVVPPSWEWRDSIEVARAAWPELKGRGGHGLASLKRHLDLSFQHHDAEEDARAAAEIVLRAEAKGPQRCQFHAPRQVHRSTEIEVVLIEDDTGEPASQAEVASASLPLSAARRPPVVISQAARGQAACVIGHSEITQGNINHGHIYLQSFFERFPADAVGGSSRAELALRNVAVDWGGGVVMTDLDGSKRFFRRRAWVSKFFRSNEAVAGDQVKVEETGLYAYRVSLVKGS